jgi:hypothetical protein
MVGRSRSYPSFHAFAKSERNIGYTVGDMTNQTPVGAAVRRAFLAQAEELRSAGLNIPLSEDPETPEWEAMLGGSALGINDPIMSHIVPRTVSHRGSLIEPEDASSWLSKNAGKIIFVIGQAGEGKTSFLSWLGGNLPDRSVVLTWRQADRLDFDLARKFMLVVQSLLPATEPPVPLFIMVDLVTEIPPSSCNSLISDFASRGRYFPNSNVTVLVATRPGWSARLRRNIDAESVTLVPLTKADIPKLVDLIRRAHRELKDMPDSEIDDRYPNLRHFLSMPYPEESLHDPGSPLLVMMLRAVYGERFHQRLVAEFEELSTTDRLAYMHVCSASVANDGISGAILDTLAVGCDLDARSRNDPWAYDRSLDLHRARHSLIGQTVVERASGVNTLRRVTQTWLKGASTSEELFQLVTGWLRELGKWEPVATQSDALTAGQFKKAGRDAWTSIQQEWPAIRAAILNDPLRCATWSSILWGLLPENPQPSEPNLLLLTECRKLIDSALAKEVNDALGQRFSYLLDKLDRVECQVRGEQPMERMILVSKWASYMGRSWCAGDFYGDLLWLSIKAIDEKINFEDWEQDDQRFVEVFQAATTSFTYLQRDYVVGDILRSEYTRLLGRTLHRLSYERREHILAQAWEVSLRLGSPDVQLALQYERFLSRKSQSSPESERHTLAELRGRVLTVACREARGWGEPVYRLANLALESRVLGLAPAVRLFVEETLPHAKHGLSLALAKHAEALVNAEQDERKLIALQTACDEYAVALGNHDAWLLWGDSWKRACRQLKELSFDQGGVAQALWQSHRDRNAKF